MTQNSIPRAHGQQSFATQSTTASPGSNGRAAATSIEECRATLKLLTEPGVRFEIRVLPGGRYERFDATPHGLRDAAAYAARWSDDPATSGVYVTLNPIGTEPEKAAKDEHIARRAWLLLDLDPRRPPDVPATDEEKGQAGVLTRFVREFLDGRGWPEPIVGDSGNGFHLDYRIDLPNDEPSRDLVKSVLAVVQAEFENPEVAVDTKVYNASRIVKLYGTMARKGPDTPDRPHRRSCIISAPDRAVAVSPEHLRDLADCGRPRIFRPAAPQADGHAGPWKTPTNGRPDALERARAYLAKCEPAVSGQRGHDKAFRAACKVGPGFDLAEDQTLRLLREEYNPRCVPPWSEKELVHKVKDAYEREKGRGFLRDADRDRPGLDTPPHPPDEEGWIDDDSIATLADVRVAIGNIKYTWERWIQPGTITTIAADAGTGKTLINLKLCKIGWDGTPWPDGAENGLGPGRRTLWLCYDRAWVGIMRAAEKMGLPDEAIILPTSKGRPLWVPDLDDPRTIPLLERLIRKHKPWALVIDTMTYATGNNVAKAHEAKLAYSPLMGVMAETGCCCLSNTHLNSEGKVLNKRPAELCRTVIKLKAPDPEQNTRLRMWVDKTDDERPDPLGVTIGGDGLVEFDDHPPLDDAPNQRGPAPEKSTGFAEWLFKYLDPGPAPIVEIVGSARDQGLLKSPDTKTPKPSLSPLYNAKTRIPKIYPGWNIDEFEQILPSGKSLKTWRKLRDDGHEGRDDGQAF